MNILATDDVELMLDELVRELRKVFPEACIHSERRPSEALKWVEQLALDGQRLDYAFLDIRMKGMDGLELARHIKTVHPKTVLIFCTAYTKYAMDAIRMYAKGYLLKPVSADDITRTLDEMVYGWRDALTAPMKDIRVQTFGHFDMFVDGKLLVFEREKAKELLAYLVDNHGVPVSTEQIAATLWEYKPFDRSLKNYISTITGSLKKTLDAAGIGNIILRTKGHLSIATDMIKCDAYDYEKNDPVALNSYKGEYMINYSWAEYTNGKFVLMEQYPESSCLN